MMDVYVAQKKESFTRDLDTKKLRKCGVSILIKQKVPLVPSLKALGLDEVFD